MEFRTLVLKRRRRHEVSVRDKAGFATLGMEQCQLAMGNFPDQDFSQFLLIFFWQPAWCKKKRNLFEIFCFGVIIFRSVLLFFCEGFFSDDACPTRSHPFKISNDLARKLLHQHNPTVVRG